MKNFIQTDSGRTLLETILVFAIVSMLSVTALYGYRMTVAKGEAHGINKQIATIVQERRHQLMEGENDAAMPRKIPGPYGVDFDVENGTSGPEKDFFSVSFTVKEKKLCEEVVKTPFVHPSKITINGVLNNDCEENAAIALWYEKSEGAGGEMGTYTDGGKTYLCPMNATCSDGSFRCKTGFYRVSLGCARCPSNAETCTHEGFTCPEGYRKTTNNCLEEVSCDYPAIACDEDGNPTACADGYYLKNNECKECPENIQTCSGTSFTCKAGYYKNSDTCTQCGDREISAAGATECTTCTTPGKTNNATHTSCTENCDSGDPNCGCSGDTPYADGNGGCTTQSKQRVCRCSEYGNNENACAPSLDQIVCSPELCIVQPEGQVCKCSSGDCACAESLNKIVCDHYSCIIRSGEQVCQCPRYGGACACAESLDQIVCNYYACIAP